jgi:hypothetical protein
VTTGACPCEQCRDPHIVTNQPGLSTVGYRVDDFAGFRRALLRPRDGEKALLGWHPAPGDLGLQVLEWWAYLGDILTFYNERIANEDYLRTAQLTDDVTRLVRLLGYKPRPAIGAVGQVAAIRSPQRPQEPLVIPAGFQVSNTATPGVPVETFEAEAATFSGPSDAQVALPPSAGLLTPGATGIGSVLLKGSVSLKPGIVLLAFPRDVWAAEHASVKVTVLSTTKERVPGGGTNTRVVLDGDATNAAWMHTANAADTRLVRWQQSAELWNQTTDSPVISTAAASKSSTASKSSSGSTSSTVKKSTKDAAIVKTTIGIRLSALVHGISAGDLVYLDGGAAGLAVAQVQSTTDEFLGVEYPGTPKPTPPTIPVAHTLLNIDDPTVTVAAPFTVRFGFRDVGTLVGTPATKLTALPVTVTPASTVPLAPGGARALLEGTDGTGIPVLATASGAAIVLDAGDDTPASFSLDAPLRLLADLVDVSRGKTVAGEELGTGDASVPGQTFVLSKSPLTYLASGASQTSTLTVAVDDILWTEVETIYDQPPDAAVFVVSQRPDGKSEVRFGDGTNGARLPTGSRVVATYRYGAGLASPPAGRLTTILRPQTNLASIHNPFAVGGGADAELPQDVRRNAPASVLAFGRAISADDYETVAALAPGVSRARAYWTWDADHQRAMVKVYVGDDEGAATTARNALAGAEDPNRPVTVTQATPIDLHLSCTLELAPDRVADPVVAAATAALNDPDSGLFSPRRMGIGRPLYSSEVEDALLVPGVEAVHGLRVRAELHLFFFHGLLFDIFLQKPVAWANPGEGSYYVLASSDVSAVVSSG